MKNYILGLCFGIGASEVREHGTTVTSVPAALLGEAPVAAGQGATAEDGSQVGVVCTTKRPGGLWNRIPAYRIDIHEDDGRSPLVLTITAEHDANTWKSHGMLQGFMLSFSRVAPCWCLYCFVENRDNWGYILSKDGQVVDGFSRHPEEDLPNFDCRGKPELLAPLTQGVSVAAVAEYLYRSSPLPPDNLEPDDPVYVDMFRRREAEKDTLVGQKVKAEDGFDLSDAFIMWDFVRLFGVRIDLRRAVPVTSPVVGKIWMRRAGPADAALEPGAPVPE